MKLTYALLAALLASSTGCAVISSDTRSSAPSAALVVDVAAAPPAPLPDEKAPCPGPGKIWVAGYWDYLGGHYAWRAGRWLEARGDFEYVRAHYAWDGHVWQFHVPHWHKRPASSPTQLAQSR